MIYPWSQLLSCVLSDNYKHTCKVCGNTIVKLLRGGFFVNAAQSGARIHLYCRVNPALLCPGALLRVWLWWEEAWPQSSDKTERWLSSGRRRRQHRLLHQHLPQSQWVLEGKEVIGFCNNEGFFCFEEHYIAKVCTEQKGSLFKGPSSLFSCIP